MNGLISPEPVAQRSHSSADTYSATEEKIPLRHRATVTFWESELIANFRFD